MPTSNDQREVESEGRDSGTLRHCRLWTPWTARTALPSARPPPCSGSHSGGGCTSIYVLFLLAAVILRHTEAVAEIWAEIISIWPPFNCGQKSPGVIFAYGNVLACVFTINSGENERNCLWQMAHEYEADSVLRWTLEELTGDSFSEDGPLVREFWNGRGQGKHSPTFNLSCEVTGAWATHNSTVVSCPPEAINYNKWGTI